MPPDKKITSSLNPNQEMTVTLRNAAISYSFGNKSLLFRLFPSLNPH
uniref:Uncharacterized protein n=1 Tax=Rhizophora mucronata TaxID=61149 RepID=A0A2P2NCH8_RHIMU